jgi:cytochrome c oxidase cbb3-type subunit I/II
MDPEYPMNEQLESFRYDDAIVRKFLIATFVWGLVGMLVGLLIALQLADPAFNARMSALLKPIT